MSGRENVQRHIKRNVIRKIARRLLAASAKVSRKKIDSVKKHLETNDFPMTDVRCVPLHQRTATGAILRTNFVGVLTRSICPYTVTVSNYTARWPDWSHAKISVRWQDSHLRERCTLWETRKTSYDEGKKRKRERTGWPLDDLKSVQYFMLFSSPFFSSSSFSSWCELWLNDKRQFKCGAILRRGFPIVSVT